MNDTMIRKAMHEKVLASFYQDGESLILDELSLCHGEARVDIAVINGKLHGYEIKSFYDTLERLPGQAERYSKIFDRMTLVTDIRHVKKALDIIPSWWGVLIFNSKNGKHEWSRKSKKNPSPDGYSLAQLFWAHEARLILESHDKFRGLSSKPRNILWQALADAFSPAELNWFVRQALKARRAAGWWREAVPEQMYTPAPPPSASLAHLESFFSTLAIFESRHVQYDG